MNYILIICIIIAIILFLYLYMRKNHRNLLPFHNNSSTPIIKGSKNKPKNSISIDEESKALNSIKEIEPDDFNDTTSTVFFDVFIDNQSIGKIIIQLFDETVPKTCHNFRYLCFKQAFNNTPFHRVIKNFMIQSGDFTNHDGTGGYSVYGPNFKDENFELTHNQPGLLSMANSGPNTNGSQFFITTEKTPWLDKKHVVFGIVLKGFDIVKQIEALDTDENDKPLKNVIIQKCGIIEILNEK